jgi:D-alanine-D-alanine ligase
MLPSSFFFHQSAEIGLNPSQFLTFILFTSLKARISTSKQRFKIEGLIEKLEALMAKKVANQKNLTKVGVVMGGYSTERHISMESGRNIFEKLSSSEHYFPIPIFLTGSDASYKMYKLPIKMMLKDNADDVKYLVENPKKSHPFIEETIVRAKTITQKFASDAYFNSEEIEIESLKTVFDELFIALHGRPGEDGSLQIKLDAQGIPYNGSGAKSSKTTINKFETNALLRSKGILVAGHRMVFKSDWLDNKEELLREIEKEFPYPFIAKPSDDGCSSAVKKIKSQEELAAFCALMFRETEEKPSIPASVLNLKSNEEFPQKEGFLIETLIEKGGAAHFLEITGGMLTRIDQEGKRVYEVFEPSETLAGGEVLSLEEKFLAGEGQNITPARFSKFLDEQSRISKEVRKVLQQTAEILDVEGYCRIDAFVRIYENGNIETIIIEINSLPGMTPATCIFHQAAINNLKPLDFINSILEYGKQRATEMTVG